MSANYMTRFLLTVLLGWASLGWIDPLADDVREGNQLYHNGKYDEALDKYINARINSPHMPQLDFNIANTQYKRSKYSEAAQLFENLAKSNDLGMKAKSSFNMGNTLYRQGKMKEALEYYKNTVDCIEETGSKDDNELGTLRHQAKYNYEFVERKMKEMEQKQQSQDQQDQQQKSSSKDKKDDQQNEDASENKDKDKQEPSDDKQESEPDDTQEKNENNNDTGQKQSDKDSHNDQQTEQQPSQDQRQHMSKEEAGRFLEVLNDAEKETRFKKRDTQRLQHRSVDKDW